MRPRVVAADERRPHLPELQDRALGSGPKARSVATLVAIPRPDERPWRIQGRCSVRRRPASWLLSATV